MPGTVRINVWSSPRNLSTAMMYAWRERADTVVFDEPLYAHYLRTTGVEHPGRDAVLASQDPDGEAVVRDLILAEHAAPVVVFKQMAKHLVGLDRGFLGECHNVLLTRDPHDMLTSFQAQVPDADASETGFAELVEILESVLATGQQPIVVESQRLLRNPERVLTRLCERLDLAPDPSMLSWPAGPKPEDGVWAEYWYDSVHRSTGWKPSRAKDVELLPSLEPVLAEVTPLYERLLPFAISPD
ncbi:MAG: sulfotransferase family protein [Actinomycetota bacterium]